MNLFVATILILAEGSFQMRVGEVEMRVPTEVKVEFHYQQIKGADFTRQDMRILFQWESQVVTTVQTLNVIENMHCMLSKLLT